MLKEEQRAQAQQVLNDLFTQQLIPFELTAYEVSAISPGEYLVTFNDSRIHSSRFSWKEGENFKGIVRAAVLARVSRMSGPLHCAVGKQ